MPRTRTAPKQTTPGERVRMARTAAGLSQSQLAEAAGMHSITICNIETCRYPLSLRSALRIARVTGVAPGTLLDELATVDGPSRCPHCRKPIG
jgi:transcriptional regulator with XRE-family HTH domain